MKAEINIKRIEVKQIDTSYKISSKQIKEAFGMKGEIIFIALRRGRSPNDIAEGKSSDEDIWEIATREIKEIMRKNK